MPRRSAPRRDIPSPAQTITDAIISRLETGTKPWVRPWTGIAPKRPLRVCGTPFRATNTFWLWLIGDLMGYRFTHVDDIPAVRRAGRSGPKG